MFTKQSELNIDIAIQNTTAALSLMTLSSQRSLFDWTEVNVHSTLNL